MGYAQMEYLRSIRLWAEKECHKYIAAHSAWTKMDAVESFVRLMDDYSTKNPNTSMIFSIASDAGKSILDDLILQGGTR